MLAVDVNERARHLCAGNAVRNGLGNVDVYAPADVDEQLSFDLIWSNPPIRIGKAQLHELLATWLDRLRPTGTAVLVVQRHLGADSLQRWLGDRGWPTERLASSKGYRLLHARPLDTRGGSTTTRIRDPFGRRAELRALPRRSHVGAVTR